MKSPGVWTWNQWGDSANYYTTVPRRLQSQIWIQQNTFEVEQEIGNLSVQLTHVNVDHKLKVMFKTPCGVHAADNYGKGRPYPALIWCS